MNLYQLEAFLCVSQELHFGRAALSLHIAQPALSRNIKALENEMGAPLFTRTTRHVQRTPAGDALIEPARAVLDAVARARRAVAAAGRGETGHVRVAFAGASTHVMVAKLAKRLQTTHPGIEFELFSSNYASPAMDKVVAGLMEIGLGRWDRIPAGIETRVVANERLVMALPASHRLAGEASVLMGQFRDDVFISLPPNPGSVLDDRLRRLCHAAGFVPKVGQQAPDTWTILSLVGSDIGCSLTLTSVAENVNNPNVSFVEVRDAGAPIQLRMAWREDDASPALREVLRLAEVVLPTPPEAN